MYGKTRSHKIVLVLGIEKATQKRRLPKNYERVEELGGRVDGCMNVGSTSILLLETLGVEIQREREANPFKLNSKILPETERDKKNTHIESVSEVEVDTLAVTMAQDGERRNPPPNP